MDAAGLSTLLRESSMRRGAPRRMKIVLVLVLVVGRF
jgi:hypothetical protein